jgi:hypothetical protein
MFDRSLPSTQPYFRALVTRTGKAWISGIRIVATRVIDTVTREGEKPRKFAGYDTVYPMREVARMKYPNVPKVPMFGADGCFEGNIPDYIAHQRTAKTLVEKRYERVRQWAIKHRVFG